MATFYISSTGNDNNDGLTISNALLGLAAAIDKAVDGDKICFLPGHHKLDFIKVNSFASAMLYDGGKNLEIYSMSPQITILEASNKLSSNRDYHAIVVGEKNSIYHNINVIFNPFKSAGYSNAIFRGDPSVAGSAIDSCNFHITGTVSGKTYVYDNKDAQWSVRNCNFTFDDPQPISDYTGNPRWVNCIFAKNPTRGVTTYCVKRQPTMDDLTTVAADCFQLGDSNILNQDGTRSHIGIHGGPYGYMWPSMIPIISNEDRNIGGTNRKPDIVYNVDGKGILTIEEYVNDELARTVFNAPFAQDIHFYFPDKIWHMLDSSPSQMKIVASTNAGSDTRIIDFQRNIHKIEFKTKPDLSPNRPVRVTVDIDTTALPENVVLKASNNAFDSEPVWEDINTKQQHIFANAEKTALNWGVSVWFVAEMGGMESIRVSNMDIEYVMEV